ncbi:MAG: baseplate J/gp47 family protein [Solibacillus sp.]
MWSNESHRRILNDVDDQYDKSDGGFAYDITKAVAIELVNVHQKIDEVEKKLNIENLSDDELTQAVLERTGLERKLATFATTVVSVTGVSAAVIYKGDLVAAGDIFYQAVEQVTLDTNGFGQVLVQCVDSGEIGNVPMRAINSFPVTLTNITAVFNSEAVTNGYPEETDASLLERYYEYLRLPPTSGNKAHYKVWAKEVTGVSDAKVIDTWSGGGTVKVVIIDANKHAASAELITNVFNHIEQERPIGAIVTVVSGKEKAISVSAKVTLATGFTIGQVQPTFEELLTQRFAEIAFKDTYVSYARIGNLLLDVPGVGDYADLKVNGGAANILLADEEIPVLNTVTLGV